jgi:hypothetical protein
MAPKTTPKTTKRSLLLLGAVSLSIASCNALVGAGAVVVLGGAGFLANQCYDRVRVRVYDRSTGAAGCDADVFVSDGDSERKLRPCYNAALTEGKWTLTARREGYVPASTELVIPHHEGRCPSYTHSVEFTLRREGEPAEPAVVAPPRRSERAPAAPDPAASEDTPASRVVPAPIPIPTRRFEPVPSPTPPAPTPPAPNPPSPNTPPNPNPPAPSPPR